MKAFVNELKQRNVLRLAAAYALVAWILIEAGSVLLPTFGAPDWLFKAYVVAVIVGFVVALVIAWVFEITPDGIRLEKNVDRAAYRPASSRRLNIAIIWLLAIALIVSISFNVTEIGQQRQAASPSPDRPSIAVLPFTSRSSDSENQYFTDGIHDDLLTRLSNIESLRVISRTSVLEYRDTTKKLPQIGKELDVATIVEGAVQRSGNQVRITVQLIDAETDEHIWANTYDREMTMANVFKIQSEISAQIANSLRAALTPEEQTRLASVPTTSLEAYTLYAAGRNNLTQRRFESLQLARQQFEQAITLDPNFAKAHAGLAQTNLILLSNHQAITPSVAYELAEQSIARALELDSNLGEAYAVLGLLEASRWEHTRLGDGNVRAAGAFRRAIDLSPNLPDAYVWFSSLREWEGDYEEAINLLTQAIRVDPLGRIAYVNLPGLLALQGKNQQAIDLLIKAMEIFPDWPTAYLYMAQHLQRLGRLDESLAWNLKWQSMSSDPIAGASSVSIYQAFGDTNKVRNFVTALPQDHPLYPIGASYLQFMDEDYAAALATLESIADKTASRFNFIYPMMVRSAVLLDDYDRAYFLLLEGSPAMAADTVTNVDRFNLDAAIMLAYIEQKRNRPARATKLLELALPVTRDLPRVGISGHGIKDVEILALMGRKAAALDALRDAIDAGFVSLQSFDVWGIDGDPLVDGIRGDPRYESMRAELGQKLDHLRRNVELADATGNWQPLLDKVRLP
ncbi:MAG: hypothetical protein IH911_05525 [Proteobacteria bacterium]|nr:hypothetical protein [Pseudomonadota bacterium]